MTSVPVDTAKPARSRGREPLLALAVTLGIAAAGLPLGWLWYAVAPRARGVLTVDGPVPSDGEPEQFIADEGWYILIGALAGVLAAVAVWALLRRQRGPMMLVALVIGSVGAGALMAWLGHEIGFADYRGVVHDARLGATIRWPPMARTAHLGLWRGFLPRVQGTVLAQAVTAAMIYTLLAAFHPAADLLAAAPDVPQAIDGTGVPAGGGEGDVSSGWTESPVQPGESVQPAPD
jgi:hypothetical protein